MDMYHPNAQIREDYQSAWKNMFLYTRCPPESKSYLLILDENRYSSLNHFYIAEKAYNGSMCNMNKTCHLSHENLLFILNIELNLVFFYVVLIRQLLSVFD